MMVGLTCNSVVPPHPAPVFQCEISMRFQFGHQNGFQERNFFEVMNSLTNQ
jgi:hypothetical protein